MTINAKEQFEKTAQFNGTQAEYERAVTDWANEFKNGFDGDDARWFVPLGVRADHVSTRIIQLQNKL